MKKRYGGRATKETTAQEISRKFPHKKKVVKISIRRGRRVVNFGLQSKMFDPKILSEKGKAEMGYIIGRVNAIKNKSKKKKKAGRRT